jgi:hypothetical protein
MTYTVTIKIAAAGSALKPTEEGGATKSNTGHMWFSLDDGQGNLHNGGKPNSYGFAPANGKPYTQGAVNVVNSLNGQGEVTYDDEHYLSTDYEKTIELTKEQYETMMDYGQNPEKYGFSTWYDGIDNSCIDFTYKGLESAGLNPLGTDGLYWPTWNDRVMDILDGLNYALANGTPFDPLFNYFDHFFGVGIDPQDPNNPNLPYCPKPNDGSNGPSQDGREAALEAAGLGRVDPLAFDLGGFHGIDTTGKNNGVLFDHNADGVKNGTGWVREYDAWLALDKDGNGTIDSGRELFGVDTIKRNGKRAKDGFDALADFDLNTDGKIDALDNVFANLRIWRDLNQDGISQSNELFGLNDFGIASINVNASLRPTFLSCFSH